MLEECLQSLVIAWNKALPNSFEFEVKVLFNADPQSFAYFKNECEIQPFIRLSSIADPQTPAAARNVLINEISEGWILFLDDDAAVEENYFLKFFEVIQHNPEVKVFGGPNLNFETSSVSEKMQGLVLGSWWGAGPFAARYRQVSTHQTKKTSSLILCHLWIKKEKSEEILFSPQLLCAEENELFARVYKARDINYFYFPQLVVFHHRRENLQHFLKQAIKFGVGRGQWLRMSSNYFITSPILFIVAGPSVVFFFFWSAICAASQVFFKKNVNLFLPVWLYCASLQIGYIYGATVGYHRHLSPLTKI